MYMDSLTITALVIFGVFFAVFVKYCLFNICGAAIECDETDEDEPT